MQFLTTLIFSAPLVLAIPNEPPKAYSPPPTLVRRTDPTFPTDIPSCVQCEPNYPNINSCAQAAPVFENASMILFNPGAFIDVIKCACTDTFKSEFPVCADCFEKTNQTDVLENANLPSVVAGLRDVCAVASVILSNVSESESAANPTASSTGGAGASPSATKSSSAGSDAGTGTAGADGAAPSSAAMRGVGVSGLLGGLMVLVGLIL